MRIETIAVHGGYTPDPTTRAVAVPIYQTVAYAFDNTQHGADLFDLKVAGNIYSRIMNPTNAVLEAREWRNTLGLLFPGLRCADEHEQKLSEVCGRVALAK
jgi:cystathionine beta-lyase/cystathionine gamma-synthase